MLLVSGSKIGSLDARVAQQLGRRAVEGDGSVLEHVAVMGHAQHLARVLLGNQDRRAGGMDRAHALEDRVEDLRREPKRRLVEEQQLRAATSARARAPASAARRRTDRPRPVPLRSFEDRKQLVDAARAAVWIAVRSVYQVRAELQVLAHAHRRRTACALAAPGSPRAARRRRARTG